MLIKVKVWCDYGDYMITVDEAAIPEGVTLRRMG